ncbi:hypothetical protein Hanom_Chr01g00065891 [Helianthus anomalus]
MNRNFESRKPFMRLQTRRFMIRILIPSFQSHETCYRFLVPVQMCKSEVTYK